jgi:hypothetical protein
MCMGHLFPCKILLEFKSLYVKSERLLSLNGIGAQISCITKSALQAIQNPDPSRNFGR